MDHVAVQALIFSAAHANYPQLPGYSRLVELFIPAMVFGLVYLRFGLLVGILTHFLYDLSLMSMPIFVASDASLWLDRGLILLAGTTPLLLMLRAYFKQGALLPLSANLRNGAQPIPEETSATEQEIFPDAQIYSGALSIDPRALVILVVLSSILYAFAFGKTSLLQWPDFEVNRTQAQALSEEILQEKGITLNGEWHRTTTIQGAGNIALNFVWRESGPEKLQELMASYIDVPLWRTTWRKFDGPVEDRSERWQVLLTPQGNLLQLSYQPPEAATGATLNREEAENSARQWLDKLGWTPTGTLEVKSVTETTRPQRSDWTLIFLDKTRYEHQDATAAIVVRIAGDQVVGYDRALDIPEAWRRAQNESNSRLQPYRIINSLLMMAVFACALATFFQKHNGRRFSLPPALPWLVLAIVPMLVLAALRVDQQLGSFATTMSWSVQVGFLVGQQLLATAVLAVVVFLASQAVHDQRPRLNTSVRQDFLTGSALACGLLGYQALMMLLFPSAEPRLPVLAGYATQWPALFIVFSGLQGIGANLLLLMLALGLTRFMTQPWRVVLIAVLAAGWWLSGAFGSREWMPALASSTAVILTLMLVFILIRRQQMGIALTMLGMFAAMHQMNLMAATYPMAWLHALISLVASALVVLFLLRHWHRNAAYLPDHQLQENL